ncbi:2-dehydropantoate 2-reductase N-terminal domain-containing protein [Xanthomonas cannabis]|uniref:ketopantoate reductase family protein n=1 Tax=Xanthomonas cannabis TaxID=1885674 RepID=UPI0033B5F993
MTNTPKPAVLIVGAGSVGIITGYHLSLAGAAVTYLVRPHRQEQLARPQMLYSYDDHQLKEYKGYDILTATSQVIGRAFDFVFVALDGASLQAESGQEAAKELGRAFRDTSTGVILASVGFGLRKWFIGQSGLPETQVTNGNIASFIYEAQAVTLPFHPGVKPELLAAADYGYRHFSPAGFMLDRAAPQPAEAFATLYERNGVVGCNILSVDDYALTVTMFGPVLAWKELGWPDMRDIDPGNETWRRGVEAMREMQQLALFGKAGIESSKKVDPEAVLKMFQQVAQDSLPFDHTAFFRYHHGGKLGAQQRKSIEDALALGEGQGLDMPALRSFAAKPSDAE